MVVKFWKQEAFQDFGSGAEEGDGSVVGTKPGEFAGLQQGNDDCFPDGGNVCVIV